MDLPVLWLYSTLPYPLISPLSSSVTALCLCPWMTTSRHKAMHTADCEYENAKIQPLYGAVKLSKMDSRSKKETSSL